MLQCYVGIRCYATINFIKKMFSRIGNKIPVYVIFRGRSFVSLSGFICHFFVLFCIFLLNLLFYTQIFLYLKMHLLLVVLSLFFKIKECKICQVSRYERSKNIISIYNFQKDILILTEKI